jgi:hypothetical protein
MAPATAPAAQVSQGANLRKGNGKGAAVEAEGRAPARFRESNRQNYRQSQRERGNRGGPAVFPPCQTYLAATPYCYPVLLGDHGRNRNSQWNQYPLNPLNPLGYSLPSNWIGVHGGGHGGGHGGAPPLGWTMGQATEPPSLSADSTSGMDWPLGYGWGGEEDRHSPRGRCETFTGVIATCAICLADFAGGDLLCRLGCRHLYHADCYRQLCEAHQKKARRRASAPRPESALGGVPPLQYSPECPSCRAVSPVICSYVLPERDQTSELADVADALRRAKEEVETVQAELQSEFAFSRGENDNWASEVALVTFRLETEEDSLERQRDESWDATASLSARDMLHHTTKGHLLQAHEDVLDLEIELREAKQALRREKEGNALSECERTGRLSPGAMRHVLARALGGRCASVSACASSSFHDVVQSAAAQHSRLKVETAKCRQCLGSQGTTFARVKEHLRQREGTLRGEARTLKLELARAERLLESAEGESAARLEVEHRRHEESSKALQEADSQAESLAGRLLKAERHLHRAKAKANAFWEQREELSAALALLSCDSINPRPLG